MLTRTIAPRVRQLAPASQAIARPFHTSRPQQLPQKAPALADITADGASTFDAKQKEFRERQVAERDQRKRKEQAESGSTRNRNPSSGSRSASTFENLGSLSTKFAEEARARDENGGKKKGPLSSLIYGTTEGRELDKDIERSFSEVLARGKYVHSIVFHEVKPDKVDEYVELVGSWYPRMASMPENKVHLVGSWRTEVGDCDTFGRFLLL
jgi:hypothetical protein